MRTAVAALFALAVIAPACGGDAAGPAQRPPAAAGDISLLVERVEALHPDPWHAVAERRFRAAATRLAARIGGLPPDKRVVELMRLTALLGERDGHSGLFPLDERHERPLHLLPLRLYDFEDGLFVVGTVGRPELVGSRVDAIAGTPVAEVRAAVEPLVPRDNEWSLRARLAQYMVVVEVLRGLGLAGEGPLEVTLDGRRVVLEPVLAQEFRAAFPDFFHPMIPQGLPHDGEPRRVSVRGSAVHAEYNVTLGDTADFAAGIARRARRPGIDRIIVDVRRNPGGDNGTYPPLLETLASLEKPVYVLIGRTTFSAAQHFIAELERARDVVFVGEPSGGSSNQWGDPVPVRLPELGLTVHVAAVYWEKGGPGDTSLAVEPDIPVLLTSGDYFAGRDPVLSAALSPTLR